MLVIVDERAVIYPIEHEAQPWKSTYMMTTHPHMQPSLLSALRFKWDPVANLLPEL